MKCPSRRWIFAFSLLTLPVCFHLQPAVVSAAHPPAEFSRKVPAKAAILILIDRADPKRSLRLTSSKGLASLSPVSDSQAGTRLLKVVVSAWGESRDGSNVRMFDIRGASANPNQKKAEPPLFTLAGYPNSKWILTVVPIKHLERSDPPPPTPPAPSITPTPPSGGPGAVDFVAFTSQVTNGGECGRGRAYHSCDPFNTCPTEHNIEFIPGTTLASDRANATALYEVEGDTMYSVCIWI